MGAAEGESLGRAASDAFHILALSKPMRVSGISSKTMRPGESSICRNASAFSGSPGRIALANSGSTQSSVSRSSWTIARHL